MKKINESIKVLMLSNSLSGGGAEKVAFDTVNALVRSKLILLKVASCDKTADIILNNSKKHYMFNGVFNFLNFFILLKNLIKMKPDVIHVHNYLTNLSVSVLFSIKVYKLFRNVRVVQTLHDHHLVCPNSSLYNDSLMNRCIECVGNSKSRIMTKRCYKNSIVGSVYKFIRHFILTKVLNVKSVVDVFLCPSLFIAKILKQDGCPSDKISIIRNPISNDFLTQSKPLVHITPNNIISNDLLFIGRLESIKGIDILLQAFSQIKKLNLKLHICGQGSQEIILKQLASDLGISKNVIFHGNKSHEEINTIAFDCKILVLPSIVYENAPLVIYESVKMGLFPIVSNIGGMKEVINVLGFGDEFLVEDAVSLSEKIRQVTNDYIKGSSHNFDEALVKVNKLCSTDRYLHSLYQIYQGE